MIVSLLTTDLEERELAAAQERESEVVATKNLEAEVHTYKDMECLHMYFNNFYPNVY